MLKMFSNRSAIAKQTIVVALIIGLVIGGVAGWFSKPAEVVTETVTETVTRTVTAPITPTPTTPTPAAPRVLRAGFAWPTYVDPAVGSDYSSSTSIVNLYDPLLYPTVEGDVIPWVAEEWEVSEDGLTWTFKIREGIKFHSGRELKADDVAFSMERLVKMVGEKGYGYLFEPYVDIEKTEVIDDYRVQFKLKKALGPFTYILVRLNIVDKEEVMAHIETPGPYGEYGDFAIPWLNTHDAGSGPYTVKEVKLEEYVDMVKFEDYWAPVAANSPDEVIFMALAVPPTERTMLVKRELEISSQWLPEEVLAPLDAEPGIDVSAYPGGDEFYYMMHTKKPPLDDVHVRKAVAYAFDYETVVEEIYLGSPVSTSCVPKGVPGWAETQIYYTDLDKAMEELEQSDYWPDISEHPEDYVIEVHWCAEVPPEEKIAILFAECMERIGLKVSVVKTPWLKMIEEGADIEASPHIETTFVATHYPDAGSLLESKYHSKSAPTWEQNEWLLDEELDGMIEDALATVDTEERFAKYEEIQHYIMEVCPSIFLFDHMVKHAYQTYIDWPAARGEYIPVMGFYIDCRTIEVFPPA